MIDVRSVAVLTVAGALIVAPVASAAPGGGTAKVRICHRTNSLTNPYVSIDVAQSSVDGDGGNDKGQGDHFLNHTGAVWTTSSTKATGWGDIIPPIDGVHGGLNWTATGMAIWSAGCNPSAVADVDGDRVPDVTDPDTDGDQVPDVTDPDDDGDRVPDTTDPDETPSTDTDGDRVPDPIDSDDDGDGLTDNTECEPKSDETAVEDTTASTDSTGDNAATERALCNDDGTVPPPPETEADTDGDGSPNETDRDDDNDGTPDATDPDEDGDGNPDVSDPDDDGDTVPDAIDEDQPPIEPSSTVDTDGDSTPDSRDRDDDGDGVGDVRDKDADGDGRPEVTPQPLAENVVLPVQIAPGESVALFRGEPTTVAGVPASATIACSPALRSALKAPMGDLDAGAVTRMLCTVKETGRATRITVAGKVPTTVTITFTSSEVGAYLPLLDVRTYRVTR